MVVNAMMLSLSESLVLDVWTNLVMEDLMLESGREAFRLLYKDTRSCVSEAIFRRSGRSKAIEAATMPVPGSAVAQIVAFTALAKMSQYNRIVLQTEEGTYG